VWSWPFDRKGAHSLGRNCSNVGSSKRNIRRGLKEKKDAKQDLQDQAAPRKPAPHPQERTQHKGNRQAKAAPDCLKSSGEKTHNRIEHGASPSISVPEAEAIKAIYERPIFPVGTWWTLKLTLSMSVFEGGSGGSVISFRFA
jgi:hypothetical protein